jgi:hypothetical protein
MYILQDTYPVLHKRIDKIRGTRNEEGGLKAVVSEKWSNPIDS